MQFIITNTYTDKMTLQHAKGIDFLLKAFALSFYAFEYLHERDTKLPCIKHGMCYFCSAHSKYAHVKEYVLHIPAPE